MVVVFPAPLRPTRPMRIPLSMRKVTSRTNSRAPMRREKSDTLITREV